MYQGMSGGQILNACLRGAFEKSSMTSGVMVTWECAYSRDNPFNLSEEYVLSRLREENERSADACSCHWQGACDC
jgi:hypothetical protein